jgi:hypothetical protein
MSTRVPIGRGCFIFNKSWIRQRTTKCREHVVGVLSCRIGTRYMTTSSRPILFATQNKYHRKQPKPFHNIMTSKIPRPPNVGTSADIPDDLCSLAHIERNNVVAWVTFDVKFERTMGFVTCCAEFKVLGVIFFLPCFWPHLLIAWPSCSWSVL